MNNRRDFLKKVALAGTSAVIGSQIEALGSNGVSSSFSGTSEGGGLIVPKSNGLKITGTFLDEISHDIPHQNWGEKEWDRDFRYMKAIGIDTVILIRSGYKKFITYPSKYLLSKGCYMPSVDLVDMFLRLAEKYGMKFWFGLYDSGKFWETRDMTYEIEHNKYVIDEVWNNYGKYKSFGGWYVGCALVGSIAGVAVAGTMSDWIGRRLTMIFASIMFSVSAIGCALCGSYQWLVFYRIVGGIGIGIVSIVSPMYISEIAVTEYRGRLVSLYQLAITVGFLGAYLINYWLLSVSESTRFDSELMNWIFVDEVWRGMLGMETLPALLFFIILFIIPESPRWLLLRGKVARSESIFGKIYSRKERAKKQVEELQAYIANETKSEFKYLFQPGILTAVVAGLCIAILGQFMGVNAVLYYGPTIFENVGLSGGDSLFYQVLIGAVNMGTTVLALLIIDKIGRKKLVYYGVSGMIVSLLLIAFYFSFGESLGLSSILMLIFFLLYVFCTAVSISAVVWVLLSEMYPTKVRGIAMSIAGFALWVGTYLVSQLTPWLLGTITPAGTFLLFAVMCVPYMLIMWRYIPETAGKSLEEIEKYWLSRK